MEDNTSINTDEIESVLKDSMPYKLLSQHVDLMISQGEQPADIIMTLNVLAAEVAIWFLYYDDEN